MNRKGIKSEFIILLDKKKGQKESWVTKGKNLINISEIMSVSHIATFSKI